MHIDSFTNARLSQLKECARNENGVLYVLKYHPQVSTWDMSENEWLRDIIQSLEEKQLILPVYAEYPWHKWILTDAGLKAIMGDTE